MSDYRCKARAANRDFNLTIDQFHSITSKPCHYCGVSSKKMGIDRKDSGQGYVLDNCVPCCKKCNQAKMNIPYEEFIGDIKRRYEYLRDKRLI